MYAPLESPHHLFQPPLYQGPAGQWECSFPAAIPPGPATWDIGAVLSLLCFGYVCGERTLIRDVRRSPWLAERLPGGKTRLLEVPPHGLRWAEPEMIAGGLLRRLEDELARACADRKELYLLLSGGLDSRIVAGVIARLLEQGRIQVVPTAVTWGGEQSRDVFYGRAVAERLGFPWQFVPLGSSHLQQNMMLAARYLGALGAPTHLHRMAWFEGVSQDALVIAGSYGDSVGRGEFSGSSLLELRGLRPFNLRGLLVDEVAAEAAALINADINSLRTRVAGRPQYAIFEVELQAQYMRGMIAHVMSIINQWCTVYQAFTDPAVYGYMWSFHPAARVDQVYTELIRALGHELIAIPWARTNRTIDRSVSAAILQARGTPDNHRYPDWMAGELREEIDEIMDPHWFAETGLFNPGAIQEIKREVLDRGKGVVHTRRRSYDVVAVLAGLRRFSERVLPAVPTYIAGSVHNQSRDRAKRILTTDERSLIRRRLASVPTFLRSSRRLRKWLLRRRSLKIMRPETD